MIGLCIASFVSWGYNVVRLRRFGPRAEPLRLPFRRIFITSANVSSAVLAVNALLFYDVILVRHYFSPVTAGLYGAAALVGRAVYTVIAFLPTIVLPKASSRSSLGQATGKLLTMALLTGGGIVACSLLATVAAPRLIVSLLAGRAFGNADAFALPYTFALGVLALANVVAMYRIGLHRFGFVIPLVGVAIGEIVAVTIWHATIHNVLLILCIGHLLALVASLQGVTDRALQRRSAGAFQSARGEGGSVENPA
jgi:O-antigen/teichoic acid export membrane protein